MFKDKLTMSSRILTAEATGQEPSLNLRSKTKIYPGKTWNFLKTVPKTKGQKLLKNWIKTWVNSNRQMIPY